MIFSHETAEESPTPLFANLPILRILWLGQKEEPLKMCRMLGREVLLFLLCQIRKSNYAIHGNLLFAGVCNA